MLILMSHAKLRDFLLLTPHLREIQKIYPNVIIAIPDLLLELYQEQNIFAHFIGAKETDEFIRRHQPTILNLSYPLLEKLTIPKHHLQLDADIFKNPQHATDSYAQALQLVFPKFSTDFKAAPFFNFDVNHRILDKYRVEPFHYFTVHSDSDFIPKNWPAEKFEKTVELLLEQHSHLKCINLVGPRDQELFLTKRHIPRLQTVKTNLREAAHLLNGSLFHIDNDSGVYHLAGALDVPSITVLGTVEPEHLLVSANKILSDYAISSLNTPDNHKSDGEDR